MMRIRLAATGVAVVALAAASPPAFAVGWPGADGLMYQFQVEVPAGALPPGGAVAELHAGASHYRARFEMPASGPARVRLWSDLLHAEVVEGKKEVVVRSDRGGVFRAEVEGTRDGGQAAPLFLGAADELAAFVRAVASSSRAKDAAKDIALGGRGEIGAPDCRRLAQARYVVAALAADDSPGPVLTCATRGASVLIVGRLGRLGRLGGAAAADPGTAAFARLGAGHAAVAWGLGAVAWLPEMRGDVGDFVAQIEATGRSNGVESMLTGGYWGSLLDADGPTPKGVPGSTLLLVLLALYVAVIGPIGYFIGVRPRRAWLAWSWFPMVALGATLALSAASAISRGKTASLLVSRVSVIAPTGVGLEGGTVRLQASSAQHYAISVPWRDGDLRSVDRGYRFGSPFASPAGSLRITDDRVTERLDIDGLAVGRYGSASVAWMAAAERGGAEVSARGREVTIVNRGARSLRHAVIRVGARCGLVAALPAGPTRALADSNCAELKAPGPEGDDSWPSAVMMRINGEAPPSGSFVLVAETDEPAGAAAKPALQTKGSDVVIVRGPLSDEEVTR